MNKMKNTLRLNFVKRILSDTISNESLRNRFFDNPQSLSESEIISALKEPISYGSLIGNLLPQRAHTMIGMKRLNNLQFCVEDVLTNNVKGDFIETGVWRGGSSIFMKLLLKEYGVIDKTVYVADSYEGLPKPDPRFPADVDDQHHKVDFLRVGLEEVQNNFKKYNVLDDKVKFLKGWFKDTLRCPPFEHLSILRLDGDMYGSTWDVLENLYDKLSIGGYVIVDDFALPGCRAALSDFRKNNNIREPLEPVDWTGVFWKKGNYDKISSIDQIQDAAISAMLFIYEVRPDLRTAFPEVNSGNYDALINWISNVTSKTLIDSYYDYLLIFKEVFDNPSLSDMIKNSDLITCSKSYKN